MRRAQYHNAKKPKRKAFSFEKLIQKLKPLISLARLIWDVIETFLS